MPAFSLTAPVMASSLDMSSDAKTTAALSGRRPPLKAQPRVAEVLARQDTVSSPPGWTSANSAGSSVRKRGVSPGTGITGARGDVRVFL